ncbi:MAG: aminopeptidase P family protein [Bacteroidetes bacterium]|nr:aminopeptidase P family protein [Bacteroidota bacterium]
MRKFISNIFVFVFFPVINLIGQTSSFPTYDNDLLPADFFKGRREAVRENMTDSSMCILFAAPERNRSNDVDYTFHQDPNFYYLTGITEANAVLILFKNTQLLNGEKINELLFIPEKVQQKEIWNGRNAGSSDASRISGIQFVKTTSEFQNLPIPYASMQRIFRLRFPKGMTDDKKSETDLYSLVEQFKLNSGFPNSLDDDFKLAKVLAGLRAIKQKEEIRLIQKAISITCDGHREMMHALEPDFSEFSIQAVGEYIFKSSSAEAVGYPSICGGGENSCILHYESNRKPLKAGELVLLDMGAEYHGYSADVTRTLPVNGKFTEAQKLIYDLVYRAQEDAFLACRPGNKFRDPHIKAMHVISEGLIQLGIISGADEAGKYFMHNTSHYLGLDVHDVGPYSELTPGNLITIEPGIYIPEGSPCDPKWWNIGVRLEEDVLITEAEPNILSGNLPRKWQDVEKEMQQKSFFNK